jgi:hypothetical protein
MIIDRKVWVPEENLLKVTRGKVTLVDLAGSESVKATQTARANLREMATTNQSLLSLSNIFSQFSSGSLEKVSFFVIALLISLHLKINYILFIYCVFFCFFVCLFVCFCPPPRFRQLGDKAS